MPKPAEPDAGPVVTLVHTQACHFCEDARAVLAELGVRHRLRVEYVDATDPVGRALLARHRAAMLPLVLVDGEFFSHGRLPRGKLRRLLAAGQPAGTR